MVRYPKTAFRIVLICPFIAALVSAGCEERQVTTNKTPFASSEPGVLIAFLIDTTGSFEEYFKSGNGKAYSLMMDTLNQLARDRADLSAVEAHAARKVGVRSPCVNAALGRVSPQPISWGRGRLPGANRGRGRRS